MSVAQNLGYSIVQVAHNFGAVAVVGGSLAAVIGKDLHPHKRLAWLVLTGWGVQALSGAAFGGISYYFYQRFPDISGMAVDALIIKMCCVATGFVLLSAYLLRGDKWRDTTRNRIWLASAALAVVALSAAAFLRWFS